jgi:hypothetical protein
MLQRRYYVAKIKNKKKQQKWKIRNFIPPSSNEIKICISKE